MTQEQIMAITHEIQILLMAIKATTEPERQHIHFKEIRFLANKAERGIVT